MIKLEDNFYMTDNFYMMDENGNKWNMYNFTFEEAKK